MKKAVVIGINEFEDPKIPPLSGCVNDAVMFASLLKEKGYQVRLLTDEFATAGEIIRRLDWLVFEAREHDSLVFARSSHGSWTVDKNYDERDFKDEVFVTYDHEPKVVEFTDDVISSRFAHCKARIVHIIDTCHSGTAFKCKGNLRNRFLNPPADIQNRVLKDTKPKESNLPKNVISLAACMDYEYALDIPTAQGGNGLFTKCLFDSIANSKKIENIFFKTKEMVSKAAKIFGVNQTPVLTCDKSKLYEDLF